MRERKYRAYDLTNNAWIYSDHMPGLAWFFDLLEKGGFEYVLEDWTDKHDKNGKEIYEGDIIEGNLFDYRVPTMGVITYDTEHACYANKNEAGLTPLSKIDQIKIIGTIHENRELLKWLLEKLKEAL